MEPFTSHLSANCSGECAPEYVVNAAGSCIAKADRHHVSVVRQFGMDRIEGNNRVDEMGD